MQRQRQEVGVPTSGASHGGADQGPPTPFGADRNDSRLPLVERLNDVGSTIGHRGREPGEINEVDYLLQWCHRIPVVQ